MSNFRRIFDRLQTSNGGHAPVAAEPTLRRLVLVAPFWAWWTELGQACEAYRRLVDRLSTAPTSGVASFIHDFPREADDRKLHDKLAAAGADGRHLYPVWHWLTDQHGEGYEVEWNDVGSAAAEAARHTVAEGLRCCEEGWIPKVADDCRELMADQLNLFGVRFFFDHVRFNEFLCEVGASDDHRPDLAPDPMPPYTVCIDLRFDIKVDAYWTFATLSLWSDSPVRHDIAPPGSRRDAEGSDDLTLTEVKDRRAAFESITRRFECFLHGPTPIGGAPPDDPDPDRHGLGWKRPRLEVFDGAYRSPRFWFAVPTDRPPSSLSYWDEDDDANRIVGPLTERFLELTDPRADSVAVARVHGEYLVQRRFIHDLHGTSSVGDEPTYLLLPGQGGQDDKDDLEETGYLIARALLELEWRAATVLFEVDSELEVARTHVRMYESNARQAGVLLDALVLHLPGTSGRSMEVVHTSIELVHQALLQGIADLADMANLIQAAVRKVGDGADELMAGFDRRLDQRAIPHRVDIRAALAERGLFSRLQEQAIDDMALAERVQTRYQSLLQEITMAFEERRVREADKLERSSWTIALLFGIVGVVTALEATLNFHWNSPPDRVLGATSLAVGGAAFVVLVAILGGLYRFRRVGTLGTGPFRQRYHKVWSFLAATSTDSLHRLKVEVENHPPEARRLWNEADRRLSADLARLWDAQPPAQPRPWLRADDPQGSEPALRPCGLERDQEVKRLAEQAESFVCETLLVSERTPRLNQFALPRFTLLYRLLSTTRAHVHANPAPRLVSDFDVYTSLLNAGFPADRWETYLTWERELLDREQRLTGAGAVQARVLLGHVKATGVRHGLTDVQADGVVCRMWNDIEAWRG
ncbi:MAG TPA: hypothetical protein VK611_29105 [Acidimicrobiales bacterium]|nr:hypothetical protein [Acidimicrobiales bacterium]